MSDLTLLPLPATLSDFASPSLPGQARLQDQSLSLQASARSRESQQELHALIAQAPGVRDSIEQLLIEHWQLGAAPVGLGFLKTEDHDEHFVSLVDAWGFICQFPDISPTLDARSTVVGLASNSLSALTPVQVLKRLQALDLRKLLSVRWENYWNTRAPGTPLSRRERAAHLYCQHFEACGQLTYAQGKLSAQQLISLQTVLNPITAPNGVRPVETCQLALRLPDQSKVKLPGAWVITVRQEPLLTQTLYLPCRQPGVMVFSQRSDMERWLVAADQQLVPPDVAADAVTVEYSSRTEALEHGILDLLSHLHAAQLESLRNRHRNGSDLTRFARHALDDADRLDSQRREIPILIAPPQPAGTPGPDADDLPPALPFGHLSADIALGQRWAAIKQQRSALERFLGDGPEQTARLAQLKGLMQALKDAEQAGNDAASGLLAKKAAFDQLELRQKPNPHYDALYQARIAALRAEGAIQHALQQISDEEHRLLLAVAEHPAAPERRPAVAVTRLILSGRAPKEGPEELTGLLLITQTSALSASAPHSLLLYWPGNAGGLQRFESRQALEHSLFKLSSEAQDVTLQLSLLTGDPIEYSLQQQLYASEQKAYALISLFPVPPFAQERADGLDKLKEQTLFTLQTPVNPARELAYGQLLEQQRSAILAGALPGELSQLPAKERLALKRLVQAQISALHRSQRLLERELEPFDDFGQRRLDQRLREDFQLEHAWSVQLDLPDAVSQEREYLSEYAGPGTPFKYVMVPSSRRSTLSLLQLAQQNIDPTLAQRLTYMKLDVTGADALETTRLTTGLSLEYLKTLVKELDLAGAYESLITRTFLGDPAAAPFTNQHRRECLTEPLRLMLMLQGKRARALGRFDDNDLRLLNIAIDADNAGAWQVEGKKIVLLPATLSAGGEDTDFGPTTLSGVTFIQEQVSGLTLLYLPNSPDNQDLRRYPSLELARKALYDLSLGSGMSAYLAGLAIKGDTAAHLARIAQAQQRNFDPIFAVGTPWPATTSLAAHLLNAHMGRVIEAHRATSRSNAALLLEQNALRAGLIFNYLKIALGLVPFVGSVVALYDAWSSANLATAAFLRGNVGHGLAEVEAVLLSLIDCAMDILPGSLALPVNARAATRQRQLRHLASSAASLHLPSVTQARRAAQRFAGYEYEGVISLAGLQPQTHGFYRNVYRHTEGDFIVRRGRIYQVELAGDPLDWRLSPTRSKTYKQPIALDENGEWDTHYGVYGSAFKGGLAGGGSVLGHMAEVLDPIWPQSIRDYLPRWWTDRALRRQQALANTINSREDLIASSINRTEELMARANPSDPAIRRSFEQDIELYSRQYQELTEFAPFTSGNRQRAIREDMSRNAARLTLTTLNRARYHFRRIEAQVLELRPHNMTTIAPEVFDTPELVPAVLNILRQRKRISSEILRDLDLIDADFSHFNRWFEKVTDTAHRGRLSPMLEQFRRVLNDSYRMHLRLAHRFDTLEVYPEVTELSWWYLRAQARDSYAKVSRAQASHFELPNASANITQRRKVLEDCIQAYEQFRLTIRAWNLGYPQHFDQAQLSAFFVDIDQMIELARRAIKDSPASRPAAGQPVRRVFDTEDNISLVGTESIDPQTQATTYRVENARGPTETWIKGPGGKSRLKDSAASEPAPPESNVKQFVASEARARLDNVAQYESRVIAYIEQKMLPVDLEHLLVSEAAELNLRANRLERLDPTEDLVRLLRAKAAELTIKGRNLRIRQTLVSKTPTEGYLDYLREQRVVDIRKGEPARNLNEGKKGRADFLQEYVVQDLTQTPPVPLWYAHFHYDKAGAQFDEFIKAHLKIPEQRNLGLQWQVAQAQAGATVDPIWRGNIGRPLATRHFAGV
ncbi:dermonecrotic toxin domain-containing protein [Pseudomonas yamanorum]|uniref:dermonecrotic toxin domain-containing protein n=1 Tax=Pseudomonas yamanorum TaxID=515393 RepID=UPI003F756455